MWQMRLMRSPILVVTIDSRISDLRALTHVRPLIGDAATLGIPGYEKIGALFGRPWHDIPCITVRVG